MKFLKVLINSLVTGIFFAFLLALLVYDLNINLDFQIFFFGQISLFLLITYGMLIMVLSLLSFFILQFILGKRFRIAFLSPSFLVMSFSLTIALFLLIFKTNYDYFRSFFDSVTRELLQRQFLILAFLALLGLCCIYGFQRYRKGVIFLILYYVFFFAGVYYTLMQRMDYLIPKRPEKVANLEAKKINKKVTIIGLEGLSFDVMIPLISEEKLPNFAWLMEEGSWGKLENFSPTEPLILNSSFNSGKYPSKHRHVSLYRYRVLKSAQEFEVAPRFMLFGQLLRTSLLTRSMKTHPFYSQDIWEIFHDNKIEYLVLDWPYDRKVGESSPKAETRFNMIFKDLKLDGSEMFDRVKRAFFSDFEYEDQVMQKKTEAQPQIVYFMLNGLNTVEQYFYKYSFPDLFGNINQDDINRYSSVIERYYQFYDDIIGKYMASRKEDELLIVFSPHGIEPLPLWKRVVEWILGNAEISAYHELAPDGVVFFNGREINRGNNIDRMRLIDIAPTLLNYLGLPVGKDMDGIVYSSIFREEFKLENPVLYISSYDEHVIKQPE
jgi:predicted AlkP superfamily pyrophosphatase or phosphodiesterase